MSQGPTSTNIEEIQKEFTRQSSGFENNWVNRSSVTTQQLMDKVLRKMHQQAGPILPTTRALDVATGTGIFARSLLPYCAEVVGLDATQAMLDLAVQKTAETDGGEKAFFLLGDASAMPFPDGCFDLVTSRLAIHHFPEPSQQVKEIARVVRPGGRVVLVDIVSPDNEEIGALLNKLETLRDPTHTKSLTVAGLQSLLANEGLDVVDTGDEEAMGVLDNEMDLQGWLESTKTGEAERAEIQEAIEAELSGTGPSTGMYPRRKSGGSIAFLHKYAVVQAIRPVTA
eukprot:INCI15783.2.p1 GENE.INCI15783.2~~INCI15783.2.p1  ORF type:complete len:327 (-),score=69.71 INCI15783.2:21-872(-)